MFCFLIDPTGWAEIDGQAFAPGFFAWNSEVGKRSIGISTFWFQNACQNHIVWDATEIVVVTRKHTAGVHSALDDVRRTLDSLVRRRDERRDGFVRLMQKAMHEKLGTDADEVAKVLAKHGINRQLAKQALELARQQGAFTIFAIVDALTRLSQQCPNAGDRLDAGQQAARLFDLVSPGRCGGEEDETHRLYDAVMHDSHDGIFSFFPCIPAEGSIGFARPVIHLPGFVNGSPQARKKINPAGIDEARKLWRLIVDQVLDTPPGLRLGVEVDLPRRRHDDPPDWESFAVQQHLAASRHGCAAATT